MSTRDGLARKWPKIQLSDIFIPADRAKKNATLTITSNSSSSTLGDPSVILGDWLYLGNRYHAKSRELLQQLHITHILNITATIPCSFPDIIQYAHIKVFDESTVKLYHYFEAAADFIDICNPLNYDINKEPNQRKKRILIHCAMGISRSATITISYLMSRSFIFNKTEQKIINHIQQRLEVFDDEIKSKINEQYFNGTGFSAKMFSEHRNNKDVTKRTRKKYKKYKKMELTTNDEKYDTNNIEQDSKRNDEICIGLTLGESYLFVFERRNVICPNIGFCRGLEIWEKFVWDNNDSTLYQVPFFRPNLDEHYHPNKNKNITKNNDEHEYQCKQCCSIM